jgi:hypothetical protein
VVAVNVVFPGRTSTVMTRSFTSGHLSGMMKCFLPCLLFIQKENGGKSAAKAARSTVWGASARARARRYHRAILRYQHERAEAAQNSLRRGGQGPGACSAFEGPVGAIFFAGCPAGPQGGLGRGVRKVRTAGLERAAKCDTRTSWLRDHKGPGRSLYASCLCGYVLCA